MLTWCFCLSSHPVLLNHPFHKPLELFVDPGKEMGAPAQSAEGQEALPAFPKFPLLLKRCFSLLGEGAMIMRKPFHIPASGRDSLEGHSRGMSVRDDSPASSRQLLQGAARHRDFGPDVLIDCCHPARWLWLSLTRHVVPAASCSVHSVQEKASLQPCLSLPGFCQHLRKPPCKGDTGEGKDRAEPGRKEPG